MPRLLLGFLLSVFLFMQASIESFANEEKQSGIILGETRKLPPVQCEVYGGMAPAKVVWSPDSRRLADIDCGLVLWDVATWTVIKHDVFVPTSLTLAFVDGGNAIITPWLDYGKTPIDQNSAISRSTVGASKDFKVDIGSFPPKDIPYAMTMFDGRTGDVVRNIPGPQFDGFGTILHLSAVSRAGNAALLFNAQSGQALALYGGSGDSKLLFGPKDAPYHNFVYDMAFSPDGRTLAMLKMIYRSSHAGLTYDTRRLVIVLWDVVENRAIKTIDLPITRVTNSKSQVRWSPDGHDLAVGFSIRENYAQVRRIDVRTGKTIQTQNLKTDRNIGPVALGTPVWSMDWSADGKLIAICSNDYYLRILDAASLKSVREIQLPNSCAWVAFSPDTSLLASVLGPARGGGVLISKILNRSLH